MNYLRYAKNLNKKYYRKNLKMIKKYYLNKLYFNNNFNKMIINKMMIFKLNNSKIILNQKYIYHKIN